MGLAKSRVSAKGQVSIPVSVMRQFGLAPGEVIIWDNLDGHLTVEKAGQFSIEDVCRVLKLSNGIQKTEEEIREGIKTRMRTKQAGR